jgi:hypothetical protein
MNWLYYLVGGIVLLLVILAIVAFFIHRNFAVRLFKHRAWRKLYNLAQDQDYFLLNDVVIQTESDSLHINHLLVGDKYVYVIATRYYEDTIKGESFVAPKWQVVDKPGNVLREITNPVAINERRTIVLAKFLDWNQNKSPMFISIVVINNATEAQIADPTISPYSYLVHKKDVGKLVKQIEKEAPYAPFDEKSVNSMISRIHNLSTEANAKEKKEEAKKDEDKKDKQ